MSSKLDEIVQAAIAYNNYDQQTREFYRKNPGLKMEDRSKEIMQSLRKRLISHITNFQETE